MLCQNTEEAKNVYVIYLQSMLGTVHLWVDLLVMGYLIIGGASRYDVRIKMAGTRTSTPEFGQTQLPVSGIRPFHSCARRSILEYRINSIASRTIDFFRLQLNNIA